MKAIILLLRFLLGERHCRERLRRTAQAGRPPEQGCRGGEVALATPYL